MLDNFIVLLLEVTLGCAVRPAASAIPQPIVDLGYAVHQGTFNEVIPFNLHMKIWDDLHADNEWRPADLNITISATLDTAHLQLVTCASSPRRSQQRRTGN